MTSLRENHSNNALLRDCLPAGSLILTLTAPYHLDQSGGWHDWPGSLHLSGMVRPEVLEPLYFLVVHRIVAATYWLGTRSKLFIRVYITPNGLSNLETQGRRSRRERAQILTDATRYMSIHLSRLTQDRAIWNADGNEQVFLPIFSQETDCMLVELYNALPSPSISGNADSLGNEILDETSTIDEMLTGLYRYQRQAVAVMVERELHPRTVPDPLYVPIHAVEGVGGQQTLFLQPATMVIVRERPSVSQIRGGILCEELGTGKTVTILALIACTLDQLPTPETCPDNRRPSRRQSLHEPKPMYLTSATLVVVPANLEIQWISEIKKHCGRRLASRVYCTTNGALPNAQELCDLYDIVLMTYPSEFGLSREYNKSDCNCTGARADHSISSLLQVRWKRLVIDEGHIAGTSDSTKLMAMIKILSTERKWIVTGTPTRGLMGLRFGEGCQLMYPDDDELEYADPLPSTAGSSGASAAGSHSEPSSHSQPTELEDIKSRLLDPSLASASFEPRQAGREQSSPPRNAARWTNNDRQDLRKIGRMLSGFLEVPAFAADPKLFSTHVIAPLMDKEGPRPGSVQVVSRIMESVMIRHRVEDVEKEVTLPPISQETVLLDLDPHALKTYNAIQAMLVINAIESERTGPDYIFHSANKKFLWMVMNNISQALVWHTDEERLHADEVMERANDYIKRAEEKLVRGTISPADVALLREALDHVKSAVSDPAWRGLVSRDCVSLRIYNMPEVIYEAWSPLPPQVSSRNDLQHAQPYHLLMADRLRVLMNLLIRHPSAQIPQIVEWGQAVSEANEAIATTREIKEEEREAHIARSTIRQEVHEALKLLASDQDAEDVQGNAALLSSCPLKGVRIGDSSSSKLNYILREVKTYQAQDKFLIFSRSGLTLSHVADGLSLIGVRYKFKALRTIREIEQDVMAFESSETYRVFLLELEHGARGLNIVTASRVIFCEPVWQADDESQAIKRCHRLGQTSPVTVKTLVIRGTFEEALLERRNALKRRLDNHSGKLHDITEDNTMRGFVAKPTFLPELPSTPSDLSLDFAFLPPHDGPPPQSEIPAERLIIRIPPVRSSLHMTTRPNASLSVEHGPVVKRVRFTCTPDEDVEDGSSGRTPPRKRLRMSPRGDVVDLLRRSLSL